VPDVLVRAELRAMRACELAHAHAHGRVGNQATRDVLTRRSLFPFRSSTSRPASCRCRAA
jgi:hypothetical protein